MKTSEAKKELWRKRLESQCRSGLSIKLWCQKEQVPRSIFYKWRNRLLAGGENLPKLIKISMAEQENDRGLEIRTPLGYVIRLSSVTQVVHLKAIVSSLS
ncbi:MAG: hypothetical protein ON057_001970 [Glomeribacter sp. 1016415]|nr:hypothetical protein [Glomeribacter sp. 1016415]